MKTDKMKNKTLKDIEKTRTEADSNYNMKIIKFCDSSDLKQEAIKWVKKWKEEIKFAEDMIESCLKDFYTPQAETSAIAHGKFKKDIEKFNAKIEAISEFHNITEEDLK